MKNSKIIYKNFIQKKYLSLKQKKTFDKKYKLVFKNITKDLSSSNNIFTFFNKKINHNLKFKDITKFKKLETVVIIGMGGSSLGSEAVYEYLKHKIKKEFIFLNNINTLDIEKIKRKNLNKILFLIISKSGNTIETISNLLALRIIRKNSKNILIISEKGNNKLYLLSKKYNIHFIEHKKFIGGRFSVLSEVGLVPSVLMGINTKALREDIMNPFNNKTFLKTSSINLACLLNNKRFNNIIFLNYIPKLNKFLFWLQQLIAESLGKKGKGFLPTISSAPKDHHSMLQLYLDGQKDKVFYIFSLAREKKKEKRIKTKDKILKFLKDKTLDQIKEAQKNAFIKSLKKKSIPFREFEIKKINEQSLGELFSYFILETIIIGKITNVNPFDQPAVEKVKLDTKKLLS